MTRGANREYKWFVVLVLAPDYLTGAKRIRILSGWEYREDALDSQAELEEAIHVHQHGPDRPELRHITKLKVWSRRKLNQEGVNPNDYNNWRNVEDAYSVEHTATRSSHAVNDIAVPVSTMTKAAVQKFLEAFLANNTYLDSEEMDPVIKRVLYRSRPGYFDIPSNEAGHFLSLLNQLFDLPPHISRELDNVRLEIWRFIVGPNHD